MAEKAFHIRKISQISICVHNLEVAKKFYEETLGLHLIFSMSNMAILDCEGTRIILSIPENSTFDHPSSTLYFDVEDIGATYEHLLAQDVPFLGKPHIIAEMNQIQTWMAFFKDPDGNIHALSSEIRVH